MIDKQAQHTTFSVEAGNLGPAYDYINQTDHYQKGRGITGRTWATADVIFIPDLSVIRDSEFIRTARAAGAVAAVSFPYIIEEKVYGVLFFFSFRSMSPSEERLNALRNIGRLVGHAFSRLLELERETRERGALHQSAEGILAVVQAAERGDLTRETPSYGDNVIGGVACGLNNFFAILRQSVRSIIENADALTASAEALNRLSIQMLQHSGETSNNAAGATVTSREVSQNRGHRRRFGKDAGLDVRDRGERQPSHLQRPRRRRIRQGTSQIGTKIAAIQKDTAGAVHSISEIATVVERVSDISSTIARTVEDQSSTTRNIVKNVSQAAVGSSAIAGKIADVAKVAQDTQQAAIQTQSAARALTRMASELRNLVGSFKVD
jgi:methyl-accepting chemotaxis protein